MKLKLKEHNGVSVLEISGEPSLHDLNVLSAGLKKLIASGKVRLVLDVTQSEKVSPAIQIEIVKLHSLATALNATIAFVGKGDLIRSAAQSAGIPVRYFPTLDAALGSFSTPEHARTEVKDAYKDMGLDALKTLHADLQARNQHLKSKVESLGAGDLKKIEAENAFLKKQISRYTARVAELKKYAKEPTTSANFEQKIAKAEAYLEDFLKKEGLIR